MKTNIATGLLAATTLLRNAPEAAAGGAETTPAEAAAPAPEKKERIRKNGQTRPEVGSKTGLIWDLGDEIVRTENRVPTREQVWEKYEAALKAKGETAAETTLATQFGRWVIFHGYQAHVKANRVAAKAAKEASEADAKASKEAEKAAEKAKKAAEKEAEKKAKAEKREADKKAKEAAAAKTPAAPAPESAPEDGQVDAAANGADAPTEA